MHHRTPFDVSRLLTLIDAWYGELRQLPDSDAQKARLLTELGDLKARLAQEHHAPHPATVSPRAGQSNPSAKLAREQALADSLCSGEVAVARASGPRCALRDWLERLFRTLLPAPDNFPLYELFFDTKLSLLNVLYPEMEREVEGGLLNAARLLGCLCCSTHDINSAQPDVCIAFQLMRKERTRELNLHDWLQSFCEVVASRKETKEQEQARFFHAVDSLQLLGYVRSGKTRKADHIIRCDL